MKLQDDLHKPLEMLRPVQVLQKAFDANRFAHAILLHGHDIRTLEQICFSFSNQLLANDQASPFELHPPSPAKHPDFFALRPMNKMRQIGVDSTRTLIRNIHHSPSQGKRKVAVIYEADRMNTTAANAFLKTLEEPPDDTTLFLITTKPYALLDTIRSRCLSFKIPSKAQAIDDPSWQQWLDTYTAWIQKAQTPTQSPDERAERVMTVYQMVFQFSIIAKRLAEECQERDTARNLTDEEILAQQVSLYKSFSRQLFTEIAIATRNAIYKELDSKRTLKLCSAIKELERVAALIEVNLNESTALEHFFLRSLQIWAQAHP